MTDEREIRLKQHTSGGHRGGPLCKCRVERPRPDGPEQRTGLLTDQRHLRLRHEVEPSAFISLPIFSDQTELTERWTMAAPAVYAAASKSFHHVRGLQLKIARICRQ